MARPKSKITHYSINTRIRDLTEEQLKNYAEKQEMTITDTLNAAVWYCQSKDIDLAIWKIKQGRKKDADTDQS